MLPGTIMYAYFGSLITNIATIGQGERASTTSELALKIVGFIATVAVTIYVTKIAKKALDTKVA